jgi:formate dehydrogenase (coenzyme F420) beta subunit
MSNSFALEIKEEDILATLQQFLKSLLALESVDAVLAPYHLPMKKTVMPSLISDPELLDKADPLAPAFPINAAKLVSRLTRKPSGGKIAVVMKSCETRAFIELVKLKQGYLEDLYIIGIDCLGAFSSTDYADFAGEDGLHATRQFVRTKLNGSEPAPPLPEFTSACRICEKPFPENADLAIGILGMEPGKLLIETGSQKGDQLAKELSLVDTIVSMGRKDAKIDLEKERIKERDLVFEKTAEIVADVDKLSNYLADCVNCYNCRIACPVCYCKECVMLTDVFDYDPSLYLKWSEQKGIVKMPTDTVFYHLTRMSHMSLACVGCGQCTNACPNDIPLTELFRTVAHQTQQAFEYEAGRSLEEQQPLSFYRENEYEEVVGIKQKGA